MRSVGRHVDVVGDLRGRNPVGTSRHGLDRPVFIAGILRLGMGRCQLLENRSIGGGVRIGPAEGVAGGGEGRRAFRQGIGRSSLGRHLGRRGGAVCGGEYRCRLGSRTGLRCPAAACHGPQQGQEAQVLHRLACLSYAR
jgi:hypothetical protein